METKHRKFGKIFCYFGKHELNVRIVGIKHIEGYCQCCDVLLFREPVKLSDKLSKLSD